MSIFMSQMLNVLYLFSLALHVQPNCNRNRATTCKTWLKLTLPTPLIIFYPHPVDNVYAARLPPPRRSNPAWTRQCIFLMVGNIIILVVDKGVPYIRFVALVFLLNRMQIGFTFISWYIAHRFLL